MTKSGQKFSFGAIIHFNLPGRNFCQWKNLIGAVLSISENEVKGQVHHMTKHGQNSNELDMNFCQWKRLTGAGISFPGNLRSNDQGHHTTKYGKKYNFESITPFKCTR